MGSRAVIVIVCSLLAGGICSCGARNLAGPKPDGGGSIDSLGGGNGDAFPDAVVTVTPQSGFTIDHPPDSFQRMSIRLACSAGGDALAYYTDAAGGQVRRYHAGVWADPVALPVVSEQVRTAVMSPDGAGTFGWSASDASAPHETANLYVARIGPTNDWSGPTIVGDGGIGWWQEASPPTPVIALGDSGIDFVTWSRIDQPTPSWPSALWSTHLGPDGAWILDGNIDLPGGTWSSRPSVLTRAQGDAIAAWAWSDGNRARVLVARRVGSVWTAPSVLEDASATDVHFWVADGPMLAGGRTGDVALVYQRSSAQAIQLLTRNSPDGKTWTEPAVLAPSAASWFQVVHNGAGSAVVIWSDLYASTTTPTPTAMMRVLVPGAGWTAPMSALPQGVSGALVAQHPDGRIALLYGQGPPQTAVDVILRRYQPTTGWRDPEIVDRDVDGPTGLCFAGDALLAAWQRPNGGQAVVGVLP